MANNHKRDQWLQDIEARQRNVVFPETVRNEGRFWRNLMEKGHLTATQIIGISLMYVSLLGGWLALALMQFRAARGSGRLARSLHVFGVPIITAFLLGFGFLFLRWRVRKALNSTRHVRRS